MQRFSSFFFSSNPKTPSPESKPLVNRNGTESADKPRLLSRNEANRRNAEFLKKELSIQDHWVLAQATQALESTLNALLDSRPPVLRVWEDKGGWHCNARPANTQELGHLLHLGQFLVEHRQRAAVFVLAATVLQLKDPFDEDLRGPLHGLMLACGQAIRQAPQPIEASLLQALQGLSSECAQAGVLSRDELALFLSADTDPPTTHPAFEALLDRLGASPEQRRQALERDELRQAFDALQSGTLPALTVWNEGGCRHCLVPPGDERGGRFDQLVWFAHQLQALHIPGAANLLAALALAAYHQDGLEINLIESCGRALLDRLTGHHGSAPPARTGALPHEVLKALCARVGELVARGALPAEWLQTFESVAQQHQAPDCVAVLRLRGITLDIQRLGMLEASAQRQTLAARLVLDIQKVHRLLGANGLDGSGALALMRTLLAVCGNDAQAKAVQAALETMDQKTPRQLAREQGIDDTREAMASWLPSFDKRSVDDAVRLYLSRDDAAMPGLALQRQTQLLQYIEDLADSPQAPGLLIKQLVAFATRAFPAPTATAIDGVLRLCSKLDGTPLSELLTQLLKTLPTGTPWTTPQRGRLVALVLRLPPKQRAEWLKRYLEQGPLGHATRTQQEAVHALWLGLSQLAKGTKPDAVLVHVLHTLNKSGVADVPEWRPLAQGLLLAWLERDHGAARLQSPELLRFVIDVVVPPVEHTAVAEEACAELAGALHHTLLRLDQREPSSRQAAPVDLFGRALLQPDPQHLTPLQRPKGLGLLQAAWRALVPERPEATAPLPAADTPAAESPPFAG